MFLVKAIMSNISDLDNKCLLEQASVAALELQERDERIASAINRDTVSESESDTAVVSNISLVERKRRNLLQKLRRRKARLIAEQRYVPPTVNRQKSSNNFGQASQYLCK